jgi:hypothetical protein
VAPRAQRSDTRRPPSCSASELCFACPRPANPLASSRYRDSHAASGAKYGRGDAKVLADLVRTNRHNHRQVAGDSDLAEAGQGAGPGAPAGHLVTAAAGQRAALDAAGVLHGRPRRAARTWRAGTPAPSLARTTPARHPSPKASGRWVGILHTCLQHGQLYDEDTAWGQLVTAAA